MANMSVFTYSPSEVKIIISGHILTAWNKCVIEYTEPTSKMIRGIRGKNTRVRIGDTSTVFTIDLEQTSLSNAVLEEIEMKDRMYGTGRISVSIIDSLGNSRFQTTSGYISRQASLTYAADATDRQWVIESTDSNTSTNNGISGLIGSLINGF